MYIIMDKCKCQICGEEFGNIIMNILNHMLI